MFLLDGSSGSCELRYYLLSDQFDTEMQVLNFAWRRSFAIRFKLDMLINSE